MRSRLAILLIVLSAGLNVAFVAMWAVHALPRHLCGRSRPGQDEGVWCPIHRRMDVSEAQWREIEPRLRTFRAAARDLCAEVNQSREELIALIAAPEVDRTAIEAKQEEILAGQRKMQSLVIEHLLNEKETLTAEQQETFFRMLRRRSGCAGHGPAMGMGLGSGPAMRETCRGRGRE